MCHWVRMRSPGHSSQSSSSPADVCANMLGSLEQWLLERPSQSQDVP